MPYAVYDQNRTNKGGQTKGFFKKQYSCKHGPHGLQVGESSKPADGHFSSCIIYQDIAGNRAEDTKDQYRDDKAGDGGVVKQFHGITAQLVDCIGGEKETGAANSEISAFKCRKIYSCFPVDHTLGCR